MYRLAAYVPLFLISFLPFPCYAANFTGTASTFFSSSTGSSGSSFNLTGTGFSAMSSAQFGTSPGGCALGATCYINFTILSNFSNSSGSFNGVPAGPLNGSLAFSAIISPQNTGDITVPMNMAGSLTGQQGSLSVWTAYLVGTGTMTLSLAPPSGVSASYQNASMSFSGATVVPEPASWQLSLMILLPLAAYAACRRRPNKMPVHV